MLDAAIYLERTRGNMNSQPYTQGSGYQYVSSFMNGTGGQFRQPPFPPNPPHNGFTPPPNPGPNPGRQPGFNPPPYGAPGFNGVPPYKNPNFNYQRNSVDEFLNKASNKAEKVIGDGTSNFFVVRRNGMKLIQLPILLFIIMLFAAWPVVFFALVMGLFFDCKYSFEGRGMDNKKTDPIGSTPGFTQAAKNDVKNNIDLNQKKDEPACNVQPESTVSQSQPAADNKPSVNLDKTDESKPEQ